MSAYSEEQIALFEQAEKNMESCFSMMSEGISLSKNDIEGMFYDCDELCIDYDELIDWYENKNIIKK
jgi:hypothetical protein